MYSAIVDAFDEELNALAKGKIPEIENLVYKIMDGEDVDTAKLSPKEVDYVKTAKVLLGQTLYSDSWLQL